MAGMKQLSAGSSQILMMMFRDKNNAPIKADSVHVKGSIFTGSSKPFEFEVNKGVCTNCKIQNDMLLFNIVPLLGLGQMQVYTQTFLGDAKAITGTYISENQQKLGVEVVQKGTFLSDRQGAMWVDVYLPIEINDAAQIPWVPAGADEQWIKDYLDKYVKTPAFAATLAALGGASKNLSNVDAKDFEKKAKDGNPIQQGESVRFLANSNIDDGFYLQSGTDGKPLFEVIINFKEMVGMPFIPDELEKGATEFYE